MKVCIAEKPSVAKEIAIVLGANNRKDGYWEGNGYAVTWTFGHFCSLYNPDDYRSEWKRWDLNSLPMLPERFLTKLKDDKGVKKQFAVIKKLFKSASVVINCGDAGQEGELIQRWVIKEAKYKGRVDRLWISSLTKDAIQKGFKKLRPASDFDQLYFAGSARAIGDWLLGMNATRLYTLKYGGGKQVLSIGRVQTPTLAMLVKRHKEIESFVSKPFWELETVYREVVFKYEKGRFEKIDDGQSLLDQVQGKPFTILSSTKKKGKEYAPKLFDLTGLQVHCNKRFGYSADKTLKIIQKLYEKKVVTYPRVDTTFLPNDVYPQIKSILGKLTGYQEFTTSLMDKPIRKTKRVFNDKKVTDHHAIIPTGDQSSLSYDESKVYDVIVRRFIANFYPDCLVNNAVVRGESEGVIFKTKGKEIEELGWKVLYPKRKKDSKESSEDSKEEEKTLPLFKKDERGSHEPSLVEKQTQAPKYYTEATLLRGMETAGKTVADDELRDLMKENGIGRPSTRANIIETLFRRKYAVRDKKLVLASNLGIQLIDTIENPLLKSAELTGQWEKKIRLIELGDYNTTYFINEMKKMTSDLVTEVRSSNIKSSIVVSNFSSSSKFKGKKRSAKKSLPNQKNKLEHKKSSNKNISEKKSSIVNSVCPRCKNGFLIKGKTAYGCSSYKVGCTFKIPFTYLGKKISDNQIIRLLNQGCTVNLKGFTFQDQKVEGLVRFNDQYDLVFEARKMKPLGKYVKEEISKIVTCPKCGIGDVIKGKSAYGCSSWRQGCDYKMTFVRVQAMAKGRPFSFDLLKSILESSE